MSGWASFVAVCAVIIAIAAFVEKFHKSEALDNAVRNKIVSLYIKIEHLLLRLGWTGVSLFMACLFASATDLYEFYIVSSLPSGFSKIFAILGLVIFIPTTIVTIIGLFVGFYATISSLMYHIISTSSSPKTSPITYFVAIMTLVVAVAKGLIDFIKMAAT